MPPTQKSVHGAIQRNLVQTFLPILWILRLVNADHGQSLMKLVKTVLLIWIVMNVGRVRNVDGAMIPWMEKVVNACQVMLLPSKKITTLKVHYRMPPLMFVQPFLRTQAGTLMEFGLTPDAQMLTSVWKGLMHVVSTPRVPT